MLHRWKSASLRSQLVAIMMALMLVALTATGAGTLTLLHSFLQGQVDDKLRAAVESAEPEQSFSQLQDTNTNVPTDYSLMLFSPGMPPGGVWRTTRTPTPTSAPFPSVEARQRQQIALPGPRLRGRQLEGRGGQRRGQQPAAALSS